MSLPPMMAQRLNVAEMVDRSNFMSASVTDTSGAVFGNHPGPGPADIAAITPTTATPKGSWAWYTITGTALDGVTRAIFRKAGQTDRVTTQLRNITATSIEVSSGDELESSGAWDVILEGPNGTVQDTLYDAVTVAGVWVKGTFPARVQDTLSARQYTLDGVGLADAASVEFVNSGGIAHTATATIDSATDNEIICTLASPLIINAYAVRVPPDQALTSPQVEVVASVVGVTSVTPSTVAAAASKVEYVFAGSGLDGTNWVEFYNAAGVKVDSGAPVPNPSLATEVRFTPWAALAAGVYDVWLRTGRGLYLKLSDAIEVTP